MKKMTLTILGWCISIALLASLAARLDLRELFTAMRSAAWPMLAIAATLNIGVVALKALRWQWLMHPNQRASYGTIFNATMISLAGNNVLPARGGDWLRIYLLGKSHGASKPMLASITGMDKIFEALSILILFGILSFHSTFPAWVQKGTLIISIITVAALTLCIFLLMHHKKLEDVEHAELGKFSRLASHLGSGMVILAQKRLLLLTVMISLVICLLQIETIRLCQVAFGQHLAIWVPALTYVAINLAIIVPSAPSGIGPFEFAAVLAYAWMGVDHETGFSIAIAYHAVQFIPVTIIGMVLYARTFGGRRKLPETQEACLQEADGTP